MRKTNYFMEGLSVSHPIDPVPIHLKVALTLKETAEYSNICLLYTSVICIPYSAPNPSGAMKWLNWLYSSQENYLFALYGVEGKDYEIVNGRINRLITDELFYEWMFRNKNYQMFPVETDEAYIEATKTCLLYTSRCV